MKPFESINLGTSIMLTIFATTAIAAVYPSSASALLPDSKCVASRATQDSVSTFLCGEGGGIYPSVLGGTNTGSSFGGSFVTPSSPSLLKLSPSVSTASRDPNCNMFITPKADDALSALMCGQNGGSYLVPSLLNLPSVLPAAGNPASVTNSIPNLTLPTSSTPPKNEVYGPPLPSNWPTVATAPTQANKASNPASTPAAVLPTPSPSPSASPSVTPAPAASPATNPERVTPSQKSTLGSEENSKANSDTSGLIAIGIVFALALAGGLIYIACAQQEPDENRSEDEDGDN